MRRLLTYVGIGSLLTLGTYAVALQDWLPEVVVRVLMWPIYVVIFRGRTLLELLTAETTTVGQIASWTLAFATNALYLGGLLWLGVIAPGLMRRKRSVRSNY